MLFYTTTKLETLYANSIEIKINKTNSGVVLLFMHRHLVLIDVEEEKLLHFLPMHILRLRNVLIAAQNLLFCSTVDSKQSRLQRSRRKLKVCSANEMKFSWSNRKLKVGMEKFRMIRHARNRRRQTAGSLSGDVCKRLNGNFPFTFLSES